MGGGGGGGGGGREYHISNCSHNATAQFFVTITVFFWMNSNELKYSMYGCFIKFMTHCFVFLQTLFSLWNLWLTFPTTWLGMLFYPMDEISPPESPLYPPLFQLCQKNLKKLNSSWHPPWASECPMKIWWWCSQKWGSAIDCGQTDRETTLAWL